MADNHEVAVLAAAPIKTQCWERTRETSLIVSFW